MIFAWVGAPQNGLGDKLFKPRKSHFENASIVTLSKYLAFLYLITYFFS